MHAAAGTFYPRDALGKPYLLKSDDPDIPPAIKRLAILAAAGMHDASNSASGSMRIKGKACELIILANMQVDWCRRYSRRLAQGAMGS